MEKYQKILDFNAPLNTELLDLAVTEFFEGRVEIQKILVQFQNHPKSWTRVDAILEKSKVRQTKLLALNILESCVKFRWKILPPAQREGIKSYVVNLIIKLSSTPQTLKEEAMFINKLNLVLVQIVKHEWPHNWPTFIKDLVNSSKKSQSLCANNMQILLLLSEEVFDYAGGSMTQEKMKEMKNNLNKEFALIYQLCNYILNNSQDANLLTVTLKTLLRFLHWIPVGYIFETKLIETLCIKFFPVSIFQNETLKCLTEIGSLKIKYPQYNPKFVQLFVVVITHVSKMLTPSTDIGKHYATGNPKVQEFVRHFTIFITGFLKVHLSLLENGEDAARQALYGGLTILLRVAKVDHVVIFKICLEYFIHLVRDLYDTQRLTMPQTALMVAGASLDKQSPRVVFYSELLSEMRRVLISKMAKPEEVLIVEDEHGEIVRETLPDTDAIILYKNMRECLIYLTHLDPGDTQFIMLSKLDKQVDQSEWSWRNLNTLCWAIGSISGALNENMEKTFLVRVIKDLLGLCEMKRGKDHKAVIAANIMYVVGQYPRFLKQHWKFLKTVVTKLFEFMHEKHPGVQDMSCDTFLKIAKKCRKKFVIVQLNESRPFIEEILEGLRETIKDLEQSQIHTFYEAVGEIIQAQADQSKQQALVFKLMELPNQTWTAIIARANIDAKVLWDISAVRTVTMVLKTNYRVAKSVGHGYSVQMSRIYLEMLQVYKMYSNFISKEGPAAQASALIKQMRAVKKETLKLIGEFIENSQDSELPILFKNFLPALLDPVLDDYKRGHPQARDAEVLNLFAGIITKLKAGMVGSINRIFESVFQSTLDMITKNYEDFPEHRLAFFKMLQAINRHCFPALLRLNQKQFKLVIDSIVWAFNHLERNIADTGLQILLELLENMEKSPQVANDFYRQYFRSLLQDLLGVLTDTFHKPGFKSQATILAAMFHIVDSGRITAPLWPPSQSFPNNQQYIRAFTSDLLHKSFRNLSQKQIFDFVDGLFKLNRQLAEFKTHLRDFLVQIKEFSKDGKSNADLFLEERQKQEEKIKAQDQQRIKGVPGLLYEGPVRPREPQAQQPS